MTSTWVLLRGLARDSRHWGSFPSRLRDALPEGSAVIALDLPGNGARSEQTSPASLRGMVDAYRAQLAALNVGERVNLLGLSMGAMVAVEWCVHHPGDAASAVLVNGSASGLSAPGERLRVRAAWQIACAAFSPSGIARETRIVSACTNLADLSITSRAWARHAAQGQTRPVNVIRQMVAAAQWRLPAVKPSVPMLVLASAADRLVSVECSIAIARHWSLPIVLHPTAGHEIATDDPAWLVRQCARWVGGIHVPREVTGSSSLS